MLRSVAKTPIARIYRGGCKAKIKSLDKGNISLEIPDKTPFLYFVPKILLRRLVEIASKAKNDLRAVKVQIVL